MGPMYLYFLPDDSPLKSTSRVSLKCRALDQETTQDRGALCPGLIQWWDLWSGWCVYCLVGYGVWWLSEGGGGVRRRGKRARAVPVTDSACPRKPSGTSYVSSGATAHCISHPAVLCPVPWLPRPRVVARGPGYDPRTRSHNHCVSLLHHVLFMSSQKTSLFQNH